MSHTPFFSREEWAGNNKPAQWLARQLAERHLFVGRSKFKVAGCSIEAKSIKGNLSSLLKWIEAYNGGNTVIAVHAIDMVDSGVKFNYIDPLTGELKWLDVPVVTEASFVLRYAVIPSNLLDRITVSPVELEAHPSYGDVFTKEDFIEMCQDGVIINSDGCGNLGTSTGIAEGYHVDPFRIARDSFDWPEWATHVVWFNK